MKTCTAATQALDVNSSKLNKTEKKEVFRKHSLHGKNTGTERPIMFTFDVFFESKVHLNNAAYCDIVDFKIFKTNTS